MKQTIDKLVPAFPWLGLIGLIAGLAIFFVTRRWDLLTNLTLAVGVLLFLLFAVLRPDDVRRRLSGRQTQYGTSTLLSILFFTAICVALYFIAYQNPDWRIDATETDEFTPLPETIELLESLDEPINVIGFFTLQSAFQEQEAENRLEGLQAYTNQLTYEFVDPESNPLLADQYDLTFNNTLVFTRGEGESEVFSKATAPLDDRGLHTALVQVINPVDKNVYFITGHGERDSEDFGPEGLGNAARLLLEAGFDTNTLNLFTVSEIPEDATVIVLIDQQAPLTAEETAVLSDFFARGGAAFIARDTLDTEFRARLEEGEDLLADLLVDEWGLTLRQDFVIEEVFAQAGQGFGLQFLGANYGPSSITSNNLEQFGTVFSIARSIGFDNSRENITAVNLISTSANAWGETDLASLATGFAEPGEGDAQGPLAIAVSAENRDTGARLVVVGDTDPFANTLIFQNGNSLFFENALNWLADDEVALDLTPRQTIDRQLTLTQSQLGLVTLTILFLGPTIAIIIGVAVWYSRRQRR